jgi:hypothetical protein
MFTSIERMTLLAALAVLPVAAAAQKNMCSVTSKGVAMRGLPEASGLAMSRLTPGRLWSHNDGGEPWLVALSSNGAQQARVRITGVKVQDWEALAIGKCPQGNCLYVGDIGDNSGNRPHVTIYRVPEPDGNATQTAQAQALRASYPDGPQDAEAMFVLPNGSLFVVTKGENGPVRLYRVPPEFGKETTVQMQRIATVMEATEKKGAVATPSKITDASASADGKWVALRSRASLALYEASELVAGKVRPVLRYQLSDAQEEQGEGVTFAENGALWLASEGGGKSRPGTLARLECTLP